LAKVLGHFFPDWKRAFAKVDDPRDPTRILYPKEHLIWSGILMYMMHLGSRRQFRYERDTPIFVDNLRKLCGHLPVGTVADPDTLAYYAERMDPSSLKELLAELFRRMVRCRALDSYRLRGRLPIAIDGTQMHTFTEEPWKGCPHRELSNGSTQWFAFLLDAKFVSSTGFALTLATEMLTNEGKAEFDKQDCELKGFMRLARTLKATFPRMPFCILLDSLSANQPAIGLCEIYGWDYIINFKSGSMPARYKEAEALCKLEPQNRYTQKLKSCKQNFRWAADVPVGTSRSTVLWCEEIPENGEPTTFCWLTNFTVKSDNVHDIANKGGRLRWKIENEGYNVQKKHGYAMEHVFSEHPNASRVFYLLLLLAHFFTQLILHSNLFDSLAESFGSARNFARRLAESMRNDLLPEHIVLPGQIRFHPP
jgi:hypothetical protein